MDNNLQSKMAADIAPFRLPRYAQIPDIGLYLEQVVRYINARLAPLGEPELTGSMVSNYVKKGIISHPVKKKYTREQLASLIYIVVSKTVLSMENIDTLFKMQRQHYSAAQAYDYFCEEVENCLPYVFGLTHTIRDLAADAGEEKLLLRSTIISAANKMYLDCAFAVMRQEEALWPGILADLA